MPWWAWLGVFVGSTFIGVGVPIAYLASQVVLSSIRSGIVTQIENTPSPFNESPFQYVTLPGIPDPNIGGVRLQLIDINVNPRVLLTHSTIKFNWSSFNQEIDSRSDSKYWAMRYREPLNAYFHVNYQYDHNHPLVRIRWQAFRKDNGYVIAIKDGYQTTIGSDNFNLEIPFEILSSCNRYKISCRVYIPVDDWAEEIFNKTVFLEIEDEWDTGNPYVQWYHYVGFPVNKLLPSGQIEQHIVSHVWRESRIHRKGGCAFANMAYKERERCSRMCVHHYKELPFPIEELKNRRKEVCDYCFFGGPEKTEPLNRALAEAWAYKGVALYSQGHFTEADEAFAKAKELGWR